MIISVSQKKEYIPEWNGNRTEDKPIRVIHRAPTMSLYEELIPKPRIKMKIDKEGAQEGETELVIDNTAIVKKMVTEIVDCELDVDGKRVVIASADDLYGTNAPAILSGFVEELGKYFQGILADRSVNTKN
jgi:hypothetical protein